MECLHLEFWASERACIKPLTKKNISKLQNMEMICRQWCIFYDRAFITTYEVEHENISGES